MCKALMLLACLSTTSGWLVPLSGVVRPAVGPSASRSLRMQEAEAAQTSDAFTEDLLDALAADEPLPEMDASGEFATAEGAPPLSNSTNNPNPEPHPHLGPQRGAKHSVKPWPWPERPSMNPQPPPLLSRCGGARAAALVQQPPGG